MSSSGRRVPGAEPERGGQRPGDQQRHHVRVGQRQRAVAAGHGTQLRGPVRIGRVHFELGEDCLGYAVEQGRLIRRMPVQDHRIPVKDAGEPAHGQPVHPVPVDQLQRGGQHHIAGDSAVRIPAGAAVIVAGWRWRHRGSTFSLRTGGR